jgi:two-component system, cell cycle response regulator DivK
VKFRGREHRTHESTTRLVKDNRSGKRNRFESPVVLVVDDSEDNRELCAAVLVRHGFQVVTAVDGEDAVEKSTVLRPSVILMDIGMPSMDGWEATRRIRATPGCEGVHIIVVTAFGDSESRRRSYAEGCDEHLVKPVPPSVLIDRVSAVFERLRDAG